MKLSILCDYCASWLIHMLPCNLRFFSSSFFTCANDKGNFATAKKIGDEDEEEEDREEALKILLPSHSFPAAIKSRVAGPCLKRRRRRRNLLYFFLLSRKKTA